MSRECEACGRTFDAERSSARFCGATCRKRASRRGGGVVEMPTARTEAVEPAEPGEPALVAVTRQKLVDAGRLDTVVGQQALVLAQRMCSEFDTGSAKAAVSRELRAVMVEALAGTAEASDELDELKARRERKASGA